MSEVLAKIGLTVLILIGMFIPVWIFLAANHYFDPVTFWEKAAMVVGGYVVLGGLQLWLLVLGIMGMIKVWGD